MILFVTKSRVFLTTEASKKRKRKVTKVTLNDNNSPIDLLDDLGDEYPGDDDDTAAFMDDLEDMDYPGDISDIINDTDEYPGNDETNDDEYPGEDIVDDEYPGDESDEEYPGNEDDTYPGDEVDDSYPGEDIVDDEYPGDESDEEYPGNAEDDLGDYPGNDESDDNEYPGDTNVDNEYPGDTNVDDEYPGNTEDIPDEYPGDDNNEYPGDSNVDDYPGDDTNTMTGSDAYPGADSGVDNYPGANPQINIGADEYPGAAPAPDEAYPGDTPAGVDNTSDDVYPGDATPTPDAGNPTDNPTGDYPGNTPTDTVPDEGYPGGPTPDNTNPVGGEDVYPGGTTPDIGEPPAAPTGDEGYPGTDTGAPNMNAAPDPGAMDNTDYSAGDDTTDQPPQDQQQGPGIGYDSMRNFNLYKEYEKLLTSIDSYIDKVNGITADNFETNKLIKYCVNKLVETRELCYDYMVIRFEASSYIQNRVFYQTLIVSIQLIFDTLIKITNSINEEKNGKK